MFPLNKRRFYLLSHCLCNPYSQVSAHSLNKEREKKRTQLLHRIIDRDEPFIQLPCIELEVCGARRFGQVKGQLDYPHFRKHCRERIEPLIQQLLTYQSEGLQKITVVGIRRSPSCGAQETVIGDWKGEPSSYESIESLINTMKYVKGQGVFMEELLGAIALLSLEHVCLDFPFDDRDLFLLKEM